MQANKDSHINIFGYGVTMKPLVRFLNTLNLSVRIYDDTFSQASSDEFGNALLPSSAFDPSTTAPLNISKLSECDLNTVALSIISPGIAPTHHLAYAKNLISEYDFFYRLLESSENTKPRSVWISGTNGKTSTTEMTTLLLDSLGGRSGGNIGTPLSELYVDKTPLWILETSSFSLHYSHFAAPQIYALLPIRQDHITWHGSFENYVSDKLSVLARMNKESSAILPKELANHPTTQSYQGRAYFYTDSANLADQFGIDINAISFREPFLLDSCIALAIAKIISNKVDYALINRFKIGAHRIEEFRDCFNRLWVDDSKGANIDATIEAVRRYDNLRLILGGDDKGADLEPLFAFIQQKIANGARISIFAIGSNEAKIAHLSQKYGIECEVCTHLANAVASIKQVLKNNEVALLSPAAASLDQFGSYKERGDLFKQYAKSE